jgi:uncharacterized protein Yka (UPF0111/DUF47 family)
VRYGALERMSGFELRQLKNEMKKCVGEEERNVLYAIKSIHRKIQSHMEKLESSIRNRELMMVVERAEDTIAEMNRLYSNLMTVSSQYIEYSRTAIDVENVIRIRGGEKALRDQKYNGRDSYTRKGRTG